MPIGHKRPSELFREAVSMIEHNRMAAHAAAPVNAPMVQEGNHGVPDPGKNDRQGIEGERTPQEIGVPIVESPVVSAESGNSTSDWKERIEAVKKAKKQANAPKLDTPVAEVAKEE